MEAYSRIGLLRIYGNLQSYWTTTTYTTDGPAGRMDNPSKSQGLHNSVSTFTRAQREFGEVKNFARKDVTLVTQRFLKNLMIVYNQVNYRNFYTRNEWGRCENFARNEWVTCKIYTRREWRRCENYARNELRRCQNALETSVILVNP